MERVAIRRPILEDKTGLIAANIESREYHLPWVEPFTDEASFHEWFDRFENDRYAGFVIVEKSSGDIAGIINLNEIIRGSFQCAYLGFYGMARFSGQGLMAEAMGGVIKIAFDDLGLHRLEANIQPGNTRSIALVKRLGFTHEGFSPHYLRVGGEWSDHERWALLNS